MRKNDSTMTLELFCAKKRLQKVANIRKMTAFWKWPKLATMQSGQFGSKIKIHKNMRKTTLQSR